MGEQEATTIMHAGGVFAPGHPNVGGRPKGGINKVSRLVKERMAEEIASGRKTHPAEILLDIANDKDQKVGIRMKAASDLLPYLMPLKHSLEIESPDPVNEDEIQRTKRMLIGLFMSEETTNAKPQS